MLRHFAAALAIVLLGFSPLARWLFDKAASQAQAAAFLASLSYGVYVLHYPLLVQWRWAGTPVAVGLLLLLAWLSDRKLAQVLRRPKARPASGTALAS